MKERTLSLIVYTRDSQSNTSSKAERPHINKYGGVILIRSDLKVKRISVWEQGNIELIPNDMPGVIVHSVYKPPNENLVLSVLGHLPHIVTGDFISLRTTWGYTNTDDNEEAVEQWADSCNLTLIHNAC